MRGAYILSPRNIALTLLIMTQLAINVVTGLRCLSPSFNGRYDRLPLPARPLPKRLLALSVADSDSADEIADLEARLAKLRASAQENGEEQQETEQEGGGFTGNDADDNARGVSAEEAMARTEALSRQRLSEYRRERTIGGVSLGEGQINQAIEGERDSNDEGGGGIVLLALQLLAAGVAAGGLVAFSQVPVGSTTSTFGITAPTDEKTLETPEQIRLRYSANGDSADGADVAKASVGITGTDSGDMAAIEARLAELRKLKAEAEASLGSQ